MNSGQPSWSAQLDQARAKLKKALDNARQTKREAYNRKWEQSHGEAAMLKVERVVKNMDELTSQAGSLVIDPDLSIRLHDIKSDLNNAAFETPKVLQVDIGISHFLIRALVCAMKDHAAWPRKDSFKLFYFFGEDGIE